MAASIADLIERIKQNKASLGITLYEPASEAELLALERLKGVRLSAEIRAFYQFSDGFESAEDLFRIIPINEIFTNDRLDKYVDAPHDFHIAEYLIYCDMWTVSIDPLDAESYTIYNKVNESITLTNSFTDFLEMFLSKGVFGDGGLYDWRELLVRQQLSKLLPTLSDLIHMEELDQLAESVRQKLNLVYDAESVKFIEGFVERNRVQIAPEEWQGLITSLGAFLSRCIMLNYGGSWQQDDEHGPYIAFDEQNKVFPFSKVAKQFENGLEDSVYSFYQVIPIVFKLTPLVPVSPPIAVVTPEPSRKPWYKFW